MGAREPLAKSIRFPPTARNRPPRGHILLLDPRHVSAGAQSEEHAASLALQAEGHTVTSIVSCKEALAYARSGDIDLLMADTGLPDLAPGELLHRVHRLDPDLPVVIMTDSGDIESAVTCIRQGAFDYLPRPLRLSRVLTTVNNALEQRRLRGEVKVLRKQAGSRDSFGALIGRSEAMQTVYRRIAKIAPHGTTVLILGESGTGKEMVAREVHSRSPVSGGPFVAVNCGGVPRDLIESELFGHEKGAFTGAGDQRDGLFQAASGGTLFLDEIGAMPLPQQASLLRVLEKKEIRRVGGVRTLEVEVRLIAATNSDLDSAMEAGTFRQDLYYRLSRMIINLPPVRDRVEDIPVLCTHFLARCCEEHGRPLRRLSPQALDILCNRTWPGNVRELENVIEQAVLFSRSEVIKPGDLPFRREEDRRPEPLTLDDVAREHIKTVLARTAGNMLKAARILGIPRPTLYHRMRKLGLSVDPSRPTPVRRAPRA